jgi:hypothetical protein
MLIGTNSFKARLFASLNALYLLPAMAAELIPHSVLRRNDKDVEAHRAFPFWLRWLAVKIDPGYLSKSYHSKSSISTCAHLQL